MESGESGEYHYKIHLPTAPFLEIHPHEVTEVKQGPDAENTLFVRRNCILMIYEAATNGGWSKAHQEPDFFSVPEKRANYPWGVYEGGLVVVRRSVGLEVYKWENRKLTAQFSAAEYNDAFGYGAADSTFLLGKVYPSEKHLGIITRIKSNVKFRSIELDSSGFQLKVIKQDPKLSAAWTNQTTTLSLVENMHNSNQLSIALRTEAELKLFHFDQQHSLQELTTVPKFAPLDSEYDRVLFARFNSTLYNDLLHFSTEGLTMYRFNVTVPAYEKLFYSTAYSKLRGWNQRTIATIATLGVDGTDIHELFCSGPVGLSVMRATAGDLGFDLANVLDAVSDNQAIRYALPTHIQPKGFNAGKLKVFLHTPKGLEWAEITRYKSDPVQKPDHPKKEAPIESTTNRIIPEIAGHRHQRTLWLHDQLDLAALLQPLNPHTGAVELTLPLIEIRTPFGVPIRKHFQYKNVDYSNELGRGWSFSLDYIALDRYESAFEQDHVYSLVKDNQRIILTRLYEEATEPKTPQGVRFTIDGYPDIKILFEKKRNQWKVTIDKRTLTYIVFNSFMTNTVCSTWPLCGSQVTRMANQTQPARWYLNHEVDSTGWDAKYFYDIVKNATDIRLRSIELHDNSLVQLDYAQDRLTSLKVLTMKYSQVIRFHYHQDKDQLISITQSDRPLFAFDYDGMQRLSKIVYPNGVEWTPEYSNVQINPSSLKNRVDVDHSSTVFYGPDYLVVVDANLVDGRVTLHIRDPLGGPGASVKTNTSETIHALEDIKRYLVHALADLLVVTIIYDTSKDVAVLHYSDGTGWQQRKYYDEIPLNGTVNAGNMFLLLNDTKTLRLLAVTDGQLTIKEVRSELPQNFAVHAFPHGYATYDGRMRIFILQSNGQWVTLETKKENNYFTELENCLKSFAIEPELRKSIKRGMMADMLGSFRQTVVLKTPFMRGAVLSIVVRFYIMDLSETPTILDYYSAVVPYDNMNNFKYTVSTKEKDTFVLGYRLEEKKYHLYVRESRGPHKVAFDKHLTDLQAKKHTMSKREFQSIMDTTKKEIKVEYARIYRAVADSIIFAIDLSLFGMLTNREGVLTGSHLVTYNGKDWVKKRLDGDTLRLRKVNQALSDQYRLVKMNANDTFKIVQQPEGKTVFDSLTSKPEQLQLVTPYYAAAQPHGKPVRVYFFGSNQNDAILPPEEMLNTASNQMAIITTLAGNRTTSGTVLFRCVKYFLDSTMTVLGGQTLRPPGGSAIVTAYRYDVNDLELSVDGAIFRRIRIVPGADTTRFGWYEQSIDLHSGRTTRSAFAANGDHVVDPKLREQERKQRESEEAPDTKTSDLDKMILDRGRRIQIVDLGPYRLMDEMVSYYGFEIYEKNHFGKKNRWIFNKTLIRSDKHNRYLQLPQQMDTLTGQFVPLEPNQNFVVSCWLRTKAKVKVGDQLDTLTVDVLVDKEEGKNMTSRPAEVKQRIGDWNYVETILNTSDFYPTAKLIFVIIVAPSVAHPAIDIDHIRFSPLGLPFEANIYDPISGDLKAVLGDNGLLKSYFHSPNGKKSAFFSEHGEVLQFTMASKVLYARTVTGAKPCIVETKPRRSLFNRFDQAASGWNKSSVFWIARGGSVSYMGRGGGSIEKTFDGPWTSMALRFLYRLASDDIQLKFFWQTKEFNLPCVAESPTSCPSMPPDGEVLVFVNANRISIWVDGVLLREASLTDVSKQERIFRLQTSGSVDIAEFIEMYDPRVKVTYHNLSGQPTQLILYENPETVRVREIRYDQIERPNLQTKWTKINRKDSEGFFAFYDNFITGFDTSTLLLNGTAADLNPACKGYPYTYTIYDSDPTENKRLQGLPGKQYGVEGKYKREYSSAPTNVMLNNLYPAKDGYNQKTTVHPGGAVRVTVADARGNTVAKYSKVGNYENRLSTFRYRSNSDKIEQELPPLYHEIVGTSSMVDFIGKNRTRKAELQKQWEVRYDYDEQNRVIRKRTPDGGIYQYLYDKYGILRFNLHKNANETLDRAIHFMYGHGGKITREALVNLTEKECTALLDGSTVPESTNFIDTMYGTHDADPNLRHRSKLASRRIDDDQMTEYLVYDHQEQLLKKTFVVNTINTSYSIDYEYENDKLRSIKYPIGSGDKPYKLIFAYNGNGEVTAIRESSSEQPMFEYTYNADGMPETMKVRMGTNRYFQRNFTYNEPGFLVQLADDYLTEDVSYLETDSYGQATYTPIYEGLISRTVFTAHWQRSVSSLRTGLYPEDFISSSMNRKQAAICFDVLKEKGYLDQLNQLRNTFYGDREDDLPFICGEEIPMNHLSAVASSRSFPLQYGHRYDYDDHDQLVKAKYFHGKDELRLTPYTHRTFEKKLHGVDDDASIKIFEILVAEGFISADCTNPSLCYGRPGTKSMFNEFIRTHRYYKHLQTMLLKAISLRKGVTSNEFIARCQRWIVGSNLVKSTCRDIEDSLNKRRIIGNSLEHSLASLNEAFIGALEEFNDYIPDIILVLIEHFASALGRSAGDVQSYEIDANGNHRKFYTGFSRYRLEYREGTNQITKLHRQYFDRDQREEEHFHMEHNSDGAVVKAEHKGIKHMEYDRILHRVSNMEMLDGRKLIYQYDVRAERTFKQVLNPDGTVSHEKYYIRDAHGLVLVDMEMTYLAKDQPPDVRVTSYIYKEQQLVGFVRNDKLYGVITDHEGSVRLVVRDGEVVAAYDYLPYGQIFRRYGTDLDGQLSYLYTGQEWEPETELYNYRARLYDPDIGRFYQMDPKEQYPSPYVYAGNSPVSLVDPDGEFAFAIACLIMALVGAYLGAASAAKSWNPLKWNWKSQSLWLGLLGGALTGLSIPFNMTASVGYFVGLGLSLTTSISIMVCSGITFGYFAIAAATGSWDPKNFDLTSPGIWNALLGGIATSAFMVTTPKSLISTFRSITSVFGRALFVTATVGLSLTFGYLFGALKMDGQFDVTKWDFKDPGLYYAALDGFTTAIMTVNIIRNIPKQIQKWNKKIETTLDRLAETEVFFRAKNLMRGDWSSKLSNVRFFISANAEGMAHLQRGLLPVAFYSFFVTLRLADSYKNNPVPGVSMFLQILRTVITTRGFSNRVVKPLTPSAVNVPLHLRSDGPLILETVSSGADALSSFFDNFRILLPGWFRPAIVNTPDMEHEVHPTDQRYELAREQKTKQSQTSKSSTIENCYRVSNSDTNGYYVKCYSLESTSTIVPKPDAILESYDSYRGCLPLSINGALAISCDGERSSLLSAGIETPKLFDFVDSWLLLARVAPAAIREANRIFGTIFRLRSPPPIDPPARRESQMKNMVQRLLRLETLSAELPQEWAMDWVAPMLDDMRQDMDEYLKYGVGNSAILFERLHALEADICEEMVVRQSEQSVSIVQACVPPSHSLHSATGVSCDDQFLMNKVSLAYDLCTALLPHERC